ncbi:MAG TPA: putative quinol monooxygenase [Burkholderiales bacterium]|jgi:quinol monooxygenase YgiN|nr:putative quinol monooxygenase [Burkholderiales bacterium]
MIHVIATLDLQPGTRGAFLAEFAKVATEVRTESGCIEYVPAVDAETGFSTQQKIGPDRLTVIEKWESVDALKAHDSARHMQVFRARVKDYVRGREIRMLAPA